MNSRSLWTLGMQVAPYHELDAAHSVPELGSIVNIRLSERG